MPRDVDALLALSGIGDYTARAVAVFAYGDRHPVVDTNTRRVLARAVDGQAQPGPPSRRDLALMSSLLPEGVTEASVLNAAAMELGATICTSRAPRCERCPLADTCAWLAAGRPDTGDERRRQATFEGSDRQARGAVLRLLRDAAPSRFPSRRSSRHGPTCVSGIGRSIPSSQTDSRKRTGRDSRCRGERCSEVLLGPVRQHGQLDTIAHVQLREHASEMHLDRPDRHRQALRDRAVPVPSTASIATSSSRDVSRCAQALRHTGRCAPPVTCGSLSSRCRRRRTARPTRSPRRPRTVSACAR